MTEANDSKRYAIQAWDLRKPCTGKHPGGKRCRTEPVPLWRVITVLGGTSPAGPMVQRAEVYYSLN
jgi:hypothetical protein